MKPPETVKTLQDLPPDFVFDPARASKMMTRHGHGGWLGFAYHAHGPDWVELALPWREDLVGVAETGVLASGPIISLMDNATSMAVWTLAGRFTAHATLDLRVDYMRAAVPGKTIIGRGECYKLTRTISFIRGIAYDGDPDDPVAHVIGTFMATHGAYL
ncbi:PaaI family thioesterase [Novosphingobium sp.]|uniref:PaaI family thioesterase n=1 Tax=Novosphingobium sp. TaxID=1874826 RepID=UPI003C7B1909